MPNASAPARPARPWMNKKSTVLGIGLVRGPGRGLVVVAEPRRRRAQGGAGL